MIRIFLPLICAALGFAAASCSQSEGPFAPAEAPASSHQTSHDAASAAMANPPDSPPASSTGQSTPDADQTGTDTSPAADTQADQARSLDDATSSSSGSQAAASQPVAEAEPNAPAGTPAERRASTLIGMPVVSGDGSAIGEVKDIIFDRQGRATHLVIAYGGGPEPSPEDIPDDGKPASSPDSKLTAMPWDAAVASMKDGRLVLDDTQLQSAPSFTPDAWPNLDDPAWSATADAYWRKAVRAAIAAHPGAPIDSTARQRERPARDGNGDGGY
jgi:sporulation protein YlmC with PRC-barrel domain